MAELAAPMTKSRKAKSAKPARPREPRARLSAIDEKMPDICDVYWPTARKPPALMAPATKVRAMPRSVSATFVRSKAAIAFTARMVKARVSGFVDWTLIAISLTHCAEKWTRLFASKDAQFLHLRIGPNSTDPPSGPTLQRRSLHESIKSKAARPRRPGSPIPSLLRNAGR